VEVDYDSLEMLKAALEGQDAVICALGIGTDASVHKMLIDAAVAAKVKRFIPNEFGLDIMNPLVRQLPICENKLKITTHLEARALKSGMTYTYLINSVFLDWGLQHNFILDVSQSKPTIFGSGDETFGTTTMATAVKAVVRILQNYNETINRTVYIQEAVVSQNKLLAIAKRLRPGKVWEPVFVNLAEMKMEADSMVKKGAYDLSIWYSYLYIALFAAGYGGRMMQTDNALFGIKEMTEEEIEEVVRVNLPNL